MATYRLLADHYVHPYYLSAGLIVSDSPGGQLPPNWLPTTGVDPLDADAIQKFWNARTNVSGHPFLAEGIWGTQNGRWTGVPIAPAAIRWVRVPGSKYNEFTLT